MTSYEAFRELRAALVREAGDPRATVLEMVLTPLAFCALMKAYANDPEADLKMARLGEPTIDRVRVRAEPYPDEAVREAVRSDLRRERQRRLLISEAIQDLALLCYEQLNENALCKLEVSRALYFRILSELRAPGHSRRTLHLSTPGGTLTIEGRDT